MCSLCMIAEVSLVGYGGPPGSVSPLIDGNTTTCVKPFSDQVIFEAEIHRLSRPIVTNFTVKTMTRNSSSCLEDFRLVVYKLNYQDGFCMTCDFLQGKEKDGVMICYHQCQTSQENIMLHWQFVPFIRNETYVQICEICFY